MVVNGVESGRQIEEVTTSMIRYGIDEMIVDMQ